MFTRIIQRLAFKISNYPKYQKEVKKKYKPTIKRSDFREDLKGFLLYEGKQTKSIKMISYFFILCITGSLIKHHFAG